MLLLLVWLLLEGKIWICEGTISNPLIHQPTHYHCVDQIGWAFSITIGFPIALVLTQVELCPSKSFHESFQPLFLPLCWRIALLHHNINQEEKRKQVPTHIVLHCNHKARVTSCWLQFLLILFMTWCFAWFLDIVDDKLAMNGIFTLIRPRSFMGWCAFPCWSMWIWGSSGFWHI